MHQSALQETPFFDFSDPRVEAFSHRALEGVSDNPRDKAIALYLAVRDGFAYNPYAFQMNAEQYRASHCVIQKESYCIPKSILLAALARFVGIPARLGLADVRNHISSKRMLALLQTDVFVMHGYTELYLDNTWLKATPAFDANLCRRIGIKPLEFDACSDSVFQEFNLKGNKHMEYIRDHGSFDEVPVELIHQKVSEAYPHLIKTGRWQRVRQSGSLENELDQE